MDITKSLNSLFAKNRLVLWYDDKAQYADELPIIEGVTIINLDTTPHLKARVMFDVDEPNSKFLLYSAKPKPHYTKDWFIDVSKYAPMFKADKSAEILNNLGLAARQEFLVFFSARQKFFKSQTRFNKFKLLLNNTDEPKDMDLKILSIIAKSDKYDISSIIISILSAWNDDNFDTLPALFSDIQKMDMEESFWKIIKNHFAYETQEPSLYDFALRLFASDILIQLDSEDYPIAIKNLSLKSLQNAFICLNQWRESNKYCAFYDIFADKIASELNINNWANNLKIENALKINTFIQIEFRIIIDLVDEVLNMRDATNNNSIEAKVSQRANSYWIAQNLQDTEKAPRSTYNNIYAAIDNASKMIVAINNAQDLNNVEDFNQIYSLYTKELYQVDLLYRKAIEAMQIIAHKGIDTLKELQIFIDNTYNNKYIENLAIKINRTINYALAQGWKVPDTFNQYEFFNRYVKPLAGKDKKVFVIISDGLRYEIATEIQSQINSQNRMKASLDSMLGVLPSYTALGMASLLPYNELNYNYKGDVIIDNKPTSNLEQRKNILEAHNGVAIKMDDLLAMGREQGREFVKAYNIIYIYHNHIDATGDAQKTEETTFFAVRETVSKIKDFVSHLMNNLSANNIFLTSDHGFLFQHSKPTSVDKSQADESFGNAFISKKRYVIGSNIAKPANSINSTTNITANTKDDIMFSLPKGDALYNFIGGSRFVHGGAMPQEFIVPLLQIQQLKTEKAKQAHKVEDVKVYVLGNNLRFTNKIQRFQFIQNEPVSDRNKAVTFKIGVFDIDSAITNIETVTFDSKSINMDDWKKIITLSLINKSYSRDKTYSLRLIKENGVLAHDININIDLVYNDDF